MLRRCPSNGFTLVAMFVACACLAACDTPATENETAPTPVDVTRTSLRVEQTDLQRIRLDPNEERRLIQVLLQNVAFIDQEDTAWCDRHVDPKAVAACAQQMSELPHARPDGALRIHSAEETAYGARDWPTRIPPTRFRRVTGEVTIHKGGEATAKELDFFLFDVARDGRVSGCAFPAEHWYWSAVHRPNRFAHAPRGVCGDTPTTLTGLLRTMEVAPEKLWAVRFMSEAEARAWQSGDTERIRFKSRWNPEYEYAKYFMVGTLRWWRGMNPEHPRTDYAFAVRIPSLDLGRIAALEDDGSAYLNIYEDGTDVELTTIDAAAMRWVLEQPIEVVADLSEPRNDAPRFAPLAP